MLRSFAVTGAVADARKFPSPKRALSALRKTASEAGESLLRLHGEQKQAEEALVHQGEALRRCEATEHDLLESSIRLRDDAEEAAYALEAANGQMSAMKQQVAEFHAKIAALRQDRESPREACRDIARFAGRSPRSPFHAESDSE